MQKWGVYIAVHRARSFALRLEKEAHRLFSADQAGPVRLATTIVSKSHDAESLISSSSYLEYVSSPLMRSAVAC